jgi:hypothetical protein
VLHAPLTELKQSQATSDGSTLLEAVQRLFRLGDEGEKAPAPSQPVGVSPAPTAATATPAPQVAAATKPLPVSGPVEVQARPRERHG